MIEKLKEIEQGALKEIESSADKDSLEKIRIKYLGRNGILTEIFKNIGKLPPEERPEIGKLINIVKGNVTKRLDEKLKSAAVLGEEKKEKIDVTLPGISSRLGRVHPVTKTIYEICEIFISLGFRVVEGPEIETEYYNFEALNIPLEHPSRDAFDTFYLDQKYLLRSHTSPVQARFMEKNSPPFSIVVPGKVFRPDATDASHSFMFHQVEGLAVSENIRFSDLKGALTIFAKQIFGEHTKMRFRPSFFPFTEPSAEVDISCIICRSQKSEVRGQKCSVCGGKGWLEILGAGMVNPKVFKAVGYSPERYTGFAFGMGVERIAMLKYGIDDIRLFFENDVRFLRQF
ncbi:MAG: phenylalanine--tRNA ligase subunit alpha [Candidatus Omnitrophica bacterium]|nr:phenylalanine--tRNA ligase subunit alpha [Candidatus Omnitrophota bacterium]